MLGVKENSKTREMKMARDPRYDVLFTPIKIGPKTSKNRFYQVPHCDAMGYTEHHGDVAHRRVKAEGGWGVISTEQCSIHPSSCAAPYAERRLWNDDHSAQLREWVDTMHEFGALAAVELVHNGIGFSNRKTKEYPLGPSNNMVHYNWDPIMGREMDKADIREFRRWQAEAAKRAVDIGFDIVYVYAAHDIALPQSFLSPHTNHRTDEYGGSVENRARIIGELLEDTREAVGDRAAVALRLAVDEMRGEDGIRWQEEGEAVIEMYSDLTDLFDVNISDWAEDSATSRFADEGYQEPFVAFVKQKTDKPVVSVGRFTSPDTMVSQIERGITDIIGAARPSIADPFLPRKIEEGRNEDIRECIGCNICVSTENSSSLFRCSQNPTAGEEWRRGWHPETISKKGSDDGVLIVGAGPAGLECARALGLRGYDVHLVEARDEVGGRVAFESSLPGLSAWGRVRDYRMSQIDKMKNVEVHTGSELNVQDVLGYGAEIVVLATGSNWRRDGAAYTNSHAIPGCEGNRVYTPDDIMNGKKLEGPVVVFDDDHYYIGGVIAEKMRADGNEVTIVTPLMELSRWTEYTLEVEKIQSQILSQGIRLIKDHNIVSIGDNSIEIANVYHDTIRENLSYQSLILATSRIPNDALYQELAANPAKLKEAGITKLARIGDTVAASTIQFAVYEGHRFARELDGEALGDVPYKIEQVRLESAMVPAE
jgi:dimethylamine/trimethylamine dehydrogenase